MSRKSILLKRDILLLLVVTALLIAATGGGIGALISSQYLPRVADHPQKLSDAAWLMWNKGDYQLAYQYFSRAVLLAPLSRDVYLGRGATLYAMQRFDEARSDFIKAKDARMDEPAYPALYLWLATARAENIAAADQLLAEDLSTSQVFKNLWPRIIATYLLGQISEEQLMEYAETLKPQNAPEYRCEAYFYSGSKLLIEGDEAVRGRPWRAGAIFRFKKCLAEKQKTFYEHYSAQAELRNLNVELLD